MKITIAPPPSEQSVEEGLQVLAQSDRNDGEVGTECEHGEQRQVVAQHNTQRHVHCRSIEKIECVDILEVVECKPECPSVGENEIEEEDEAEVSESEPENVLLALHRSDHTRERMLAHERVNTNTKQDRKTFKACRRRQSVCFVTHGEVNNGKQYHDKESYI